MPWWVWLSAIAAYLFAARWCMRWCRELEPDTELDIHVMVSLFVWWVVLPRLLPAWLRKHGYRLDERTLRRLVGESSWHRAERRAREHEQRCKELEIPL